MYSFTDTPECCNLVPTSLAWEKGREYWFFFDEF